MRVIYDIEAGRMVGVARRMLRRQDLAEEAVQDTFMRMWRAAGSFDPAKGSARTWLYAILRNCAISVLRDESRFESEPDAERGRGAGHRKRAGAIAGDQRAAALPGTARRRSAVPSWCWPTCMDFRMASSPAGSTFRSAR